MKRAQVQLGGRYTVRVSGRLVSVLLVAESGHGGWIGRNEATGRDVRIRTAGRLRYPVLGLERVTGREAPELFTRHECKLWPHGIDEPSLYRQAGEALTAAGVTDDGGPLN